MHTITLAELSPGDKAKVISLKHIDPSYRQKLLAMGLTTGAQFEISRFAPLGDPIQIQVRNTAISLRRSEAGLIKVEKYYD